MVENAITLLDGGMGHELKLRGISDGSFLAGVLANEPSNNATNKDSNTATTSKTAFIDPASIVESIHHDFLRAGCNVITTNSFVAVPPRMIECGLASNQEEADKRARELIRASVDRARGAVARYEREMSMEGNGKCGSDEKKNVRNRPLIAGCVPPLTECYFSEKVPTSIDSVLPGYALILTTLLESQVDILLAETLSTLREGLAIIRALSSIKRNKCSQPNFRIPPLWMSFTINDDDNDEPPKLRSNESIETTYQSVIKESKALNLPLKAIGINCSTPSAISRAIPVLAKIAEKFNDGDKGEGTIKVSAYGNCFQTTTSEWIRSLEEQGKNEDPNSSSNCAPCKHKQQSETLFDSEGYMLPEVYANYANEWRRSGATIIGGCCGCRPKHMEKVASVLLK